MSNGVLKITIPKPANPDPKKIEVKDAPMKTTRAALAGRAWVPPHASVRLVTCANGVAVVAGGNQWILKENGEAKSQIDRTNRRISLTVDGGFQRA